MLRPTRLNELVGQSKVKECLHILISSCKIQNGPLPHILFDGPPGFGKTTLARVIANEMGADLILANGSNLKTIKNIAPYIAKIKPGTIFFCDEIHAVSRCVSEAIFTLLEDFRVDFGGKEGISIEVPQFTFLGATTSSGGLIKPLYDRFIQKFTLEEYTNEDLIYLCDCTCAKYNILLAEEAKESLIKKCRGVPRKLNALLRWLQAYCISHSISILSEIDLDAAMSLIGINENGLTKNDLLYLKVLKENYPTPIGARGLEALTGLPRETIENNIEPFLLQNGYIMRTPIGRIFKKKP